MFPHRQLGVVQKREQRARFNIFKRPNFKQFCTVHAFKPRDHGHQKCNVW